MDIVTNLPAFLGAVVIMSMTPGPAFALIVRRTALRGFAYGLATVAGLELGLYIWALLVAAGFAVVAASQVGYLVLKVVGSIVLVTLAARSFKAWRAERRHPTVFDPVSAAVGPSQRSGWFRNAGEGLVVQLANPKAAVFLLALYPQFVPRDRPMFATTATLGLIQVALESLLYGLLAYGVARSATWFRGSVVRRRLEAATGTVLLVLGFRLAASDGPA